MSQEINFLSFIVAVFFGAWLSQMCSHARKLQRYQRIYSENFLSQPLSLKPTEYPPYHAPQHNQCH